MSGQCAQIPVDAALESDSVEIIMQRAGKQPGAAV
jgi:hypothetical protein